MTSDSDPKESAHERAARLEAMLDEIKDEPSDVPPAGGAAGTAGTENEPLPAPPPVADVSTPDLDQLDADWGDMNADESAKHGLLASPRAAAVTAKADLPNPIAVKADVPTSPKPVDTDDMLGGYSDDEDDDDYSAKTVIGRVPDLVALTRNQADAPLRTNLRTPRAAPVEVAEPQRDVPTIRPEPKVVIDPEADFSSVAPPAVIPPAGALPGNLPRRPLSDPPNDEPTRMAPLVLDSTPPPPRTPTSRSVPPPEKDPAARAAEKAAADARAVARKAKERSRIESLRERKKARAEAIAKKQKAKQPRKSRPPPPPDSETEAGGATLDSLPPDGYLPGESLAGSSSGRSATSMRAHARALPLSRDWRKMAMLVVIVIALGAIVLALATRR